MDSQRTPGRTLLGRLPRTTSRHFTRGALVKAAAATIVGAVIAASAVVPAQAATGDVSEAEGVLLSGSGIVNLDTIAQLKGAYSSTNATTSAGTVANPLDLTAVNALGVNLGNGVQLLGANGILQLGVAGQYAATTATTSTAAAGLVGSDGTIAVGAGTPGTPSTLNLTPLLSRVGAASAVASSAELDLGALASRIQAQRTTGAATTGYGIAGAKFQLTSPAVAGLNTSLQTTVNGVGSSLNNAVADPAALNSVVSGTSGGLTSALNTLGLGVLSLNGTALTANITGLNLAGVTAPVLAQTYTSGPVTINPSTGQIVIDLNTLQALNGQDPNTKLLSTPALQSIVTAAIQDILVTQIPTALNTAVVTAIGNATLNATLTAKISLLGGNVSNLTVNMTTSLANLLKTTGRAPLTVTASATAIGALGLNISSAVLNPLLQPLVDGTVAPLLRGLVAPTVGTITSTLAATTGLVNTTLAPLTGILNQLVTITVNAQDSTTGFRDSRGDDAGSQSVSALRLTVLPALNAATVNLATSTVNATPIAPVAITAPTVGQQFTVATPTATRSITVSGTGEPGAGVAVDLGGGRTGTATVAADGTWSSTIPGVGVGSVTASVTQTFGGVAGSPVTRAFTVVAQAPLTITSPTAGRTFTVVSNSATTPVTITGTSTPGAAIALDLGSGITGTTTAQADGTWSATIPSLAVGPYTASATQTIGGTTSAAVTRSFSVAAGAPLTVATPADGTRIVVPSATSTTTVTVTGTAQPGATVTASLGSGLTGTDTAAADGTYSIPISGVGTGPYTVGVRQTVAGTQSAAITRDITVVAASPVVIQAPAAGAQISVAGPNSTTPVTVSGTAQPNASVTVQLMTGVTATVTAGSNGAWSTTFPAVPVGDYTASATQTVAGATSPAVTRAFSVVAGADVVITAPAAGTVSTVADSTSTRSVTVSGTAQPNASVAVVLDATHTATVTANGSGAWTTTFTGVGVGDYAITAAQTVNGTSSVPVTRPYSIVAGAPVVITAPAPGATVLVAGAGTSANVRVSGTAQPNASVTIDLGGQTATVTASASGVWTNAFSGVAIGTHTISVAETVGGTTSPAVTQTLTVAIGDPVAITAPNAGDSVTVFGAGGTTTVVVSGTAQAGARVVAGFGAGLNAATTASASGAWTVSIPNVAVGDYSLSATQTINGSSAASASQAFSVIEGDGIVIQTPASGTVFAVADAGSTRPSTVVSGVADDGAAVTVTLDSGQSLSTTASSSGTWSVSFPNLTPRTYTVGASQTVGAVSSPAISTSFTIAVGDPVTITSPAAGTDYTVAAAGQTVPVTVTGSAQANAVVHVTADGRTVDVTASAAGRWSLVLDGTANGTGSGLGIGDYPVSATQTVGGTTSTLPATTDFTVSAGTPFTVAAPLDGSIVPVADDASTVTVPVSGAGQVGASVAVTHAGVAKTVTVGMNGTWSTSFPGVGTGDQTFVSVETVGSTTAGPISRTITVKAAPAVTVVAPESGSTILVAGAGSTTDVTATGTAAPNAPVTVTVGSTSVDTTATAGGTWTADLGQLGTGTYTVGAAQTVNGTTSTPITSTFQVAAAPAVVITTPAAGTTITVADDDSTTSVPVAGTASPNATVDVTIGTTTREVTASGTGAWSTTIPDVGTGTATISVTQTIGDTVSAAVTATVKITAGDPVAITTPADGSTVTVADAVATATIPVTGTAQAGASVRVTLDGGTPKTVTADNSGNWSTSFTGVAVDVDPHTIAATQTVNGTTSAAVTSDVTVEAGDLVTITTPDDGDAYVVASDSATTDVKVTGTAEAQATVTAELADGIAATTTANGDGTYTLTLRDVPTGPHTISVTQTIDGTTSVEPATVKITVGTADAVTITTPVVGTDL
ncbi:hypothetical protein EDF46_3292 [Frondihabitans sp. PhB188]|uniref:choice-of-anchor G family protein n=1 Tax=Frondihabitans sp. PhB188 TaxID=2485200 RepID=UPI000F4A2D7F|nr:choice-of-anchor G family protein [Frondihabitans sp. PhB188]ROQ36747.1 hypothetical protein EDF46_3292 [Frondihabitans sp. PhB188]